MPVLKNGALANLRFQPTRSASLRVRLMRVPLGGKAQKGVQYETRRKF
ncbi:hypothetical protein G4O51_13360 [Candidatus Bathyarchaeota archaeon A05DMB-2]|nr:hypothetical protein [Candidatus Bathyarchaeota archaeon A05DMB-2]